MYSYSLVAAVFVYFERVANVYLTKNEIEIMDVLWTEGRALARGEILSCSEDKSWMDSSVHILLNSMLKKGAIREAGFVKCGKTCGRMCEAALSCEEYYVSTLDSTRTPQGGGARRAPEGFGQIRIECINKERRRA